MKRKLNNLLPYATINILTTIIALIVLMLGAEGGNGLEGIIITSAVAIGVAILGLIGSVIIAIIQSKKQGDVTLDVKVDTSDMKPTVTNIREDTSKIRGEVVEKLVPNLQTISTMASKVDSIHSEVEYQKRLKSELSTGLSNKDYLVNGIEKLYERNGQLEKENRELRILLTDAQGQVERLRAENAELQSQIIKPEQTM